MTSEPSGSAAVQRRLEFGAANMSPPAARISCSSSRGAGRMRPSTKYQKEEVEFVPSGNEKPGKSILLQPNDERAPWTCQLPTGEAPAGISREASASVEIDSSRQPRAISSSETVRGDDCMRP